MTGRREGRPLLSSGTQTFRKKRILILKLSNLLELAVNYWYALYTTYIQGHIFLR